MNRHVYHRFYLFAIFILLPGWKGLAQPISIPSQLPNSLNISLQTEYFIDRPGTQTIQSIHQAAFQQVETNNFRVPFSAYTLWFRCTLVNTSNVPQSVFLEWTSPVIENLEAYYTHPKTGPKRLLAGSRTAESLRKYWGRNPAFRIELAPGVPTNVYFKNSNQRGYRTDLMLHSHEQLIAKQLRSTQTMSFFSGLVFIRLFFVLLLSVFAIKELAFRRYSLMIILRSLAFWGIIGSLGAHFTTDPDLQTILNFLSYHLLPLGYFLLVKVLLPLKRFPVYVNRSLTFLMLLNLVLALVILMDYRWYWLLMSTYLVLFCQLLVFALYIFSAFRKYTINWYYSAPFLLGMSSYFCLLVSLVGWINFSWVFHVGSFFFISEIFVFGLFLGKIIINHEVARNKTEKELEANRIQTQNLQELDRIKSNFFANISHEFRTPLTLLIGPLNDLQNRYPTETMLPLMQRNVQRLHKLINQFLDLSKLDAGKVEPSIEYGDLPVIIERIFASFESLSQSQNVLFHHEQSHPHHMAFYDEDKLEKILTNLLSNAFKFTPNQGRVIASVFYTDQHIRVTVEDNGIGISSDSLPFIFDRYFQAHSNHPHEFDGSGIGLSLLKELVAVLKGSILVKSTVNKGTVFTLSLPIDAQTWQNTPHSNIEPTLAAASTHCFLPETLGAMPILLIVEDNPDLRAYIKSIFEEKYVIIQAYNGHEGWQLALAQVPDIIISDVMMPLMGGFQLCEKLKSDTRTSHIPIVLLTAKATLDDRLQGLSYGADDYLSKPFDRNELCTRVHNLLYLRRQLQEKYGLMLMEKSKPIHQKEVETIEGKFLRKAIDIVESNLHLSSFNVEQFCTQMHISRTNLHRKLKALTNQSTTEFIRTLRIYRAAELLQEGNLTISEAAYAVGYESLSYFSKSFKEQIGVLPSEWINPTNPYSQDYGYPKIAP